MYRVQQRKFKKIEVQKKKKIKRVQQRKFCLKKKNVEVKKHVGGLVNILLDKNTLQLKSIGGRMKEKLKNKREKENGKSDSLNVHFASFVITTGLLLGK